jgi:hypothetical protein
MINIIKAHFQGEDGSGLMSARCIEMVIHELIRKNSNENIIQCNEGEADVSIYGHLYSIKHLRGKGVLALDWSKNPLHAPAKSRFTCDIIIILSGSGQWWKKGPLKGDSEIDYTVNLPSGIYFISCEWCQQNTVLSSNNKTNSKISERYVYEMLNMAYKKGKYFQLSLPDTPRYHKWSITNGFE